VNVIRYQVPLFDPAFLLLRQLTKHLSEVPPQLRVKRLPAALGNEHNMIFALPLAVASALVLVHRQASFRVRGGSRSEVSAMGDRRKCQTFAASQAEPGGLPVMLELTLEQGMAHPHLTDAGGRPISALPGASTFDSAISFGLIRGGHVDITVLGGLQVDAKGHLANWMIPGKMVPGMGGAMDLVTGAKRVIVAMQHAAKGKSKIVQKCSLPLTSSRPVDLVVTDLAVIGFPGGRITLLETAPGVTAAMAVTEADLLIPDTVPEMRIFNGFDEIRSAVGQKIGASEWVEITQDRINKFADATCDEQWIHVDQERADKELPGGRTIAHGLLSLSLAPMFIRSVMGLKGLKNTLNYGADRIRYLAPVPAGSRLRGRTRIAEVEDVRPNGLRVNYHIVIEIEGGQRPACVADLIALHCR
jgi:acetate CoA/acetoacetate CoA-transferase beta subunit